jgi:hypothetical protein
MAKSAHQTALVAWPVTTANMMLMTMQISATAFPTPRVIAWFPWSAPMRLVATLLQRAAWSRQIFWRVGARFSSQPSS